MQPFPFALGALVLAAGLAGAQNPAPRGFLPPPNTSTNFDNVKGSWINIEAPGHAPMVFAGEDPTFLFALNQPGMRLAVFSLNLKLVAELPVGPGAVSIVPRPGTDELWIVDQIASTVGVLNTSTLRFDRSIRVGGSPVDLVFHPSGDRAYVSSAALERVDIIRTSSYRLIRSIDIPAKAPAGMAFLDGKLWVAPRLSGNNTTAFDLPDLLGNTIPRVVSVDDLPGANPLPDRDLIPIAADPTDLDLDAIDTAAIVRGLGTVLFDVNPRPGTTELWVPHTEALNAVFRGEENFPAGQVVLNRVAIVDPVQGGPPTLVDLDTIAPEGVSCAQPTHVSFSPSGHRAYVSGFGSDVIAVLDATQSPPSWLGHYEVRGVAGDRAGVRTTLVDASGKILVAFNEADNSITRIKFASTPFGSLAPPAVPLGYDPTPEPIKQGRKLFTDARNSKSLTSSCASCHVDGNVDGVTWDLSAFLDPEGTPADELRFEVDRKGPMTTQTIRGLAETGPYHWRGEKRTLADFNGAFVGLMEREVDGKPAVLDPAQLADLVAYMQNVVHPANPRRLRDRGLRNGEGMGETIYTDPTDTLFTVASCNDCHALPLGTNGALQRRAEEFAASPTTQVVQLRSVVDKDSPVWPLGPGYPDVTELGSGLGHAGTLLDLRRFLDTAFPTISAAEKDLVAEFLRVFDTGLAPATAHQATANDANASFFTPQSYDYLLSEAQKGNCDLIAFAGYTLVAGKPHPILAAYDHETGLFQLPRSQGNQIDGLTLIQQADLLGDTTTLWGMPLGMGWRMAVDRDADGLLDWDELVLGTLPESSDTDGDGFPDGHELEHGTDPLSADLQSPDQTPPSLRAAPDGTLVHRIFVTTNTVKLDFTTTEPARAKLIWVDQPSVRVSGPVAGDYTVNHSLVLGGLPERTGIAILIELTDPAGNVSTHFHGLTTKSPVAGTQRATRVEAIGLEVLDPGASGPGGLGSDLQPTVSGSFEAQAGQDTRRLRAVVEVTDQNEVPVIDGEIVSAFVYHRVRGEELEVVEQRIDAPTLGGRAVFHLHLPPVTVAPGEEAPERTVYFGVREVLSPGTPNGSFYMEALDNTNFESLDYR